MLNNAVTDSNLTHLLLRGEKKKKKKKKRLKKHFRSGLPICHKLCDTEFIYFIFFFFLAQAISYSWVQHNKRF